MSLKRISKRITTNDHPPLTSSRRASSLPSKARQQLDQASIQGYLVTRGFQQPVATVWRKLCEQRKAPYIRVRNGTGVASIYLDLEPAGQQFPPETQDRLYDLGKLATEDFVAVNKDHLFFCKVPKEKVEWVLDLIRYVSKLDAHAA